MIAIVYPQFYGVGGIARYLDSFLANLPDGHAKIYLLTGDEHRVERRYQNVELIHIPFSSSRFNLLTWSLKARKILTQLYAQKKIQYVNLHIPPLIPGLFIPKHIPLIVTAHTTYIGMSGRFYNKSYFISQWSNLEVSFKVWMESRIFKQSEKIITLTEQGRQEVMRYRINKPVDVIPNGVDTSIFSQGNSVEKDVDVLFSGRIEHRKGSRAMAEVCLRLVKLNPKIRIVIVGYGDDDAWVKSQLEQYSENILMTGKVAFQDMQAYYRQSKIYVSTSYYEGLPGTCLEAMAMGLPVVVWDFLFYKHLVEHGLTGLLIEPGNANLMAEEIVKLLSAHSEVEKLSSHASNTIQSHYDWKRLSPQVLNSYYSVRTLS